MRRSRREALPVLPSDGARPFLKALLGPALLLAAAGGFAIAVMVLDRSNRALPSNSRYVLLVEASIVGLATLALALSLARSRRRLREAAASPLDSALPEPRSYEAALWRDLVVEARKEAQVRDAKRVTGEREGLEAFLATVHALKTPATALHLMAEKAEREGLPLDTRELRLEIDELDRILDRALGRLRLEDFESGSRLATVDAGRTARDSLRKHRRILIARRIQVSIEGGFEAATDGWWLAFILDQLVSNAAKYASTRVTVRLVGAEGKGEISVEDDGPGLDAEDALRLFARSASGSAAAGAERGPSSSGYGLWLAREAARRLGASLELGAAEGDRGTRASLVLPLAGNPLDLTPM